MDQATHNKIVSFIWGIADDVLRDLFVRGKYRDVVLPMCVIIAIANSAGYRCFTSVKDFKRYVKKEILSEVEQ